MRKIILILIPLVVLISCKNEDEISISDMVNQNRYYDSEIFTNQNLKIYGQWQFLYSYGGFGGWTIDPSYDYIEFVNFGIYGKIHQNQIEELGKIIIVSQDSLNTIIALDPDNIYDSSLYPTELSIEFKENDSLILHEIAADGFSDYFCRKR
jgi:hypothetical protein